MQRELITLKRQKLYKLERYTHFARKVTLNNKRRAYVFKADIKQYFENVDHKILLFLIEKRVKDKKIMWLIQKIIGNYQQQREGKGMPLGNLTSQFFANIYLNELDQFVKHKLKVKYYICYVDDFIILHDTKRVLEGYQKEIVDFIQKYLKVELHPIKSKITPVQKGIDFLGLRIFPYHKLLKKKNLRKFQRKIKEYYVQYDKEEIKCDEIYDFIEGWLAYASHANTYTLRKKITDVYEKQYQEVSTKEVNRLLKYSSFEI